MKWDYFHDESEKTLAPFFSGSIMTYNFRCIVVSCSVLLIMWPRQPFYHYLEASYAPLLFFQVFATVAILSAYLNLRCGRGEMIQRDYFSEYYKEPPSFEKERNFFTYGLVGFLLHTAFLLLSFAPILIIATMVSRVPIAHFAKAVIVLYINALLCRITGFVFYLLGGRQSYSGHFIVRVFIIFYLFATALFYSRVNPLHILYELNKGMNSADPSLGDYMAASGSAICALCFICHLLILRYNNRMKET